MLFFYQIFHDFGKAELGRHKKGSDPAVLWPDIYTTHWYTCLPPIKSWIFFILPRDFFQFPPGEVWLVPLALCAYVGAGGHQGLSQGEVLILFLKNKIKYGVLYYYFITQISFTIYRDCPVERRVYLCPRIINVGARLDEVHGNLKKIYMNELYFPHLFSLRTSVWFPAAALLRAESPFSALWLRSAPEDSNCLEAS